MSLKHKTFQGAVWLSGAAIGRKFIRLGTTIVLARILEPAIFGLYALAFVVIDGFGLFKSLGFDTALIQRNKDIEKAANTAFRIIPLAGCVIYAVLFVSAPFIANFMDSNELVSVIRTLGLIFVFSAFQRVPLALLEKDMQFKFLALTAPIPEIVFAVFAITFSLSGWGIWSLVVAFLIKTIVGVTIPWFLCKWRPKWEFDKEIAVDMFHFGKFIFLGSILWFVVNSFDKMVIPKIIDIATLGLYSIAFNLATFISSYVGARIRMVLFPAYSKLQDNMYNLRKAYLRVVKLMAIVNLPIAVGIYLVGGDFLQIAYGDKWIGAIPILQILAWLGAINALDAGAGGVFLALKKPKVNFIIDCINAAIIFSLLIPAGKMYGVKGVAAVVVLKSFVAFAVRTLLLMKTISIKPRELFASYQTAILTTLVMSLAVISMKALSEYMSLHMVIGFIIAVLAGVAVYLPLVCFKEKDFVKEVKGLFLKPKLS